jgi:DMSO/TMAO reductase YedYZ molybdopterin-dependent catalytic subunit
VVGKQRLDRVLPDRPASNENSITPRTPSTPGNQSTTRPRSGEHHVTTPPRLNGILTSAHGRLAAALLAGVAALVVVSRPDTAGADVVPIIVGGSVAVLILGWLVGRAAVVTGDDGSGGHRVGDAHSEADATQARRAFLRSAGGIMALGVAAGAVGRWIGGSRGAVEASRDELAVDVDLPPADPPAGADLGVPGAQPWQTPNDDFYRIDTAFQVPLVTPEDWRLRIHGLVEQDVELDYDALLDMGLVDRWVTLACVSNQVGGDLIGNAFWTGVPIADVLALARPLAEADAVLSTSHDGWTCGTPLEALTDGRDSLLAVGMNGEPLPIEHGFPVRMVVPGLYGYVSATKWVVDLEVSRFDRFDAYWTTRGWSERGPIKVSSRIDVPRSAATVAAGTVVVAGSAWAQNRGIEQVEVKIDDGDWQVTDLGEAPTDDRNGQSGFAQLAVSHLSHGS